jgi:hypothetical protein
MPRSNFVSKQLACLAVLITLSLCHITSQKQKENLTMTRLLDSGSSLHPNEICSLAEPTEDQTNPIDLNLVYDSTNKIAQESHLQVNS